MKKLFVTLSSLVDRGLRQARQYLADKTAALAAGCGALVVSGATWAQSTSTSTMETAAKTGIETAQASGLTVGGYVVAAVAVLVVVGLVIGMVKKL